LNIPLFEWVIENLCKNAIDAMDGIGRIDIYVSQNENNIILDVKDTGKGIEKKSYKTIFNPGFTTKKRGWGLGLSLAKRIIEEYHGGKIFVKSSEINFGTVFRILLKS
jgi:signal transduction histidine kinase